MTIQIIIFSILSIPIIYFSKHVILNTKSHGFYRFWGWECIACLFAINYKYWFTDALSLSQIISWIFLCYGGYLVIAGGLQLKKMGKSNKSRNDNSLYSFEKTTELVETGLYKYIRHPLYGSLIFLSWGIYLKDISSLILLLVVLVSTVLFFVTARFDEKECIAYFGEKYKEYMKRSRMFVPYLV